MRSPEAEEPPDISAADTPIVPKPPQSETLESELAMLESMPPLPHTSPPDDTADQRRKKPS
jgi:hypothetical protein